LNAIRLIDGIGPIADAYDLFLLDQWGVLHDGEVAHPEAVDAMRRLRATGKPVVLISNSSKRAPHSVKNLERMGIERALYEDVVTSGELAWREMKAAEDPFIRALGPRCYMFTWGGDMSFVEGLPYRAVETVAEADFLLLSGTSGGTISIYEDALQAGMRRRLPMICLNRDFFSVDPAGRLVECSGRVAERYEALGGVVRYYGKPGREIYDACLAHVPSARRPVAIGDSLHHDIGGGNAAGVATVFIAGGIHAFDLGIRPGEMPTADAIAALCRQQGVRPDYAMAKLAW
jgi:HAD superfamily hydrolase (TIGR01459 family)